MDALANACRCEMRAPSNGTSPSADDVVEMRMGRPALRRPFQDEPLDLAAFA